MYEKDREEIIAEKMYKDIVLRRIDEWAYAFYLGDLKWISDNSAELTMQKFALEKCEDLIVRKGNNFIARIKKYTEI